MKRITLGLLLFFSCFLQAQLNVNTPFSPATPTQIVNNYLLGAGTAAYSVSFNNSSAKAQSLADQCGYFYIDSSLPNLGFKPGDKGALLTTGKNSGARGPNDSSSASSPTATPVTGDADLAILAGGPVKNVAILEFDFVATGLTLNFDYIFGSEEYPEYAGSTYNDVFGFFLSGPNIHGSFSNGAVNLAVLPTTTTPTNVVSINNVNQSTNPQYYVSNPLGSISTQYDGLTTLLRATSPLICGQTYHIKLAIANINDNGWDSGVFIQNFECPPVKIAENSLETFAPWNPICSGDTTTLHASVTDPILLYEWLLDGAPIVGNNLPSLTVTGPGIYQLNAYTSYGCLIGNDSIEIKYLPPLPLNDPKNIVINTSSVPPYVVNLNQNAFILGSQPASDYYIRYYDTSIVDAQAGITAGSISNANLSHYTVNVLPKTIWVRIDDNVSSGCSIIRPFDIIPSADRIQLISFIDINNNGTKEDNEPNFSHGTFNYQQNNAGPTTEITSSTGTYSLYDTNPDNTYDFNFQINPEYAAYYSVSETHYNDMNIKTNSGTQTLYFPITYSQNYNDVAVTLVPWNVPRPGFEYRNRIAYSNLGISPKSGTLTFTKPEKTTITALSQSGTVATTGFSYDFSDLQPQETRFIDVYMNVPGIPTVQLTNILTSTATITTTEGDVDTTNNSSSISTTVVGSYDPNDITENHGDKIVFDDFSSNDYLTYTIRFQNTGTASADRIKIEDILDSKLDAQSIRMVSASHDYTMERVNNNVYWMFESIDLVPKTQSEMLSSGYVTFQIKLKPGFGLGDIIPNTANIYFDYNPAIETNTLNTEFVAQLKNTAFTADNVQLYPNPASNKIQINLQNSTKNLKTIMIYDVLGNCVKRANALSASQSSIDVSALAKGIYLIEIATESQLKLTKKLVIE